MIDLKTTSFFDREAVQKAVDRGARKALGKFGGYVRKVARNSMKEASGPHDIARGGQPPKYHRGRQLKDLLFYSYDPGPRSVVIGPLLFRPKNGGMPAALVLEEGGELTLTRKGKTRRAHYRPHPYMVPARDKTIEVQDPMWRDVITA